MVTVIWIMKETNSPFCSYEIFGNILSTPMFSDMISIYNVESPFRGACVTHRLRPLLTFHQFCSSEGLLDLLGMYV